MRNLRYTPFLVSLVIMAAFSRAGAASLFVEPKFYPSGNYPTDAVVQDFNHDGFADIVTANTTDNNVSVFLNQGKGTLAPAITFAVGAGATDLASADLNGDGNADLIVTDGERNDTLVSVALGHGDGTFATATTAPLPKQPQGVTTGDFNGDGIPDLAVALIGEPKIFDGQVAILLGHGDGTFTAPVLYPVGNQNAARLIATDLNHDGKLDLAVALKHGTRGKDGLGVLLGMGMALFSRRSPRSPG